MTFEELVKKLSPTLKRITYKLNGYARCYSHEDLYQEALIHLLSEFGKGSLENKTDSYILQGCYFYLKNFLRTHKDKATVISLESKVSNDEETGVLEFEEKLSAGVQTSIAAIDNRMLIEKIMNNGFSKREKEAFSLSLSGLTTREIGNRLGISHVRVVKLLCNLKEKAKVYTDSL